MMKKISIWFLLLLIFVTSVSGVFAEDKRVFDKAELMSADTIANLEVAIADIEARAEMSIVVVTTTDVEGKSSMAYADDYYDYNGFGVGADKTGVLLLINMADREVWFSTTGKAIDIFDDARIDETINAMTPALKEGDYGQAIQMFLAYIDLYGSKTTQAGDTNTNYGPPADGYRVERDNPIEEDPFQRSLNRSPIYLLIALLISGITVGVMVYNNQGKIETNKLTYLERDSMSVTDSRDILINTNVTKVRIQSNSSSGGGGSSTHSGSSGSSHGGGGGRF